MGLKMNIFVLDKNPWKCVKHYCNLHVNKMLLESCQLLCNAFPTGYAPYKHTHVNHPCSKWATHSIENFMWLEELAIALSMEYTLRSGKIHKCQQVIDFIMGEPIADLFDSSGFTCWPQVMPDEFKSSESCIKAYRRYYAAKLRDFKKRGLLSFTNTLQ